MIDWKEDVSCRGLRGFAELVALRLPAVQNVIPNHRVDRNLSEEASLSLEDTPKQKSGGNNNSCVNTVLDTAEDCDEDTGKEDDNLKR